MYQLYSLVPLPGRIEKICVRCGTSFWVPPAAINKSHKCSDQCREPLDAIESLLSKVERDKNGHWIFTGAIEKSGYGRIETRDGRMWRSHRLSWHLFRGPIPNGMYVLHNRKCVGERRCCCPDHLYIGTALENAQDTIAQGRQSKMVGKLCSWARLSEEAVRDIRENANYRGAQPVFAKKYGVHRVTISKIVRGLRWKQLDAEIARIPMVD